MPFLLFILLSTPLWAMPCQNSLIPSDFAQAYTEASRSTILEGDYVDSDIEPLFNPRLQLAHGARIKSAIENFLTYRRNLVQEEEFILYELNSIKGPEGTDFQSYQLLPNDNGVLTFHFPKGITPHENHVIFPASFTRENIEETLKNAYNHPISQVKMADGNTLLTGKSHILTVNFLLSDSGVIIDAWPVSTRNPQPFDGIRFDEAYTEAADHHIFAGDFTKNNNGTVDLLKGGMHTHTAFEALLAKRPDLVSSESPEPVGNTRIAPNGLPFQKYTLQELPNGVILLSLPHETFNGDARRSMKGTARQDLMIPLSKSLFPKKWSKKKILQAIRRVYLHPESIIEPATNSNNTLHVLEGTFDGVAITINVNKNKEAGSPWVIHSAFPSWNQNRHFEFLHHTLSEDKEDSRNDLFIRKIFYGWHVMNLLSQHEDQAVRELTGKQPDEFDWNTHLDEIRQVLAPLNMPQETENLIQAIDDYKDFLIESDFTDLYESNPSSQSKQERVRELLKPLMTESIKNRAGKLTLDDFFRYALAVKKNHIENILRRTTNKTPVYFKSEHDRLLERLTKERLQLLQHEIKILQSLLNHPDRPFDLTI